MTQGMVLVYGIHVAIILFVIYYGHRLQSNSTLQPFLLPAYAFKVLCGVGLGLLYSLHYQTGDTWGYYQQAMKVVVLPSQQFWECIYAENAPDKAQRAILFVKIIGVFIYYTKADYWLLSLSFSTLSFAGSYYLVYKLVKCDPLLKWPGVLSFLFFPSMAFWSSGILKESLAFGALCFVIGLYINYKSSQRSSIWEILIGLLSIWLLISLKYYIAASILPCLVLLFLWELKNKYGVKLSLRKLIPGTIFAIMAILFVITKIHPNLEIHRFLWALNDTRSAIMEQTGEAHAIEFFQIENAAGAFAANSMLAIISGLFRPFIYESFYFPAILSGLENLLVLFLMATMWFRSPKIPEKWALEVIVLCVYVVVVAAMLAYTIPNFGTLARFKVYYMPFLLLIVLSGHHWVRRL